MHVLSSSESDSESDDMIHMKTSQAWLRRAAAAAPTKSTAKSMYVGASRGGTAPASAAKANFKALVKGVPRALTLDIDGLPDFARASWITSFLPTLYSYLSAATNPWELHAKGSNLVKTIQKIFDAVYPGSRYKVKLSDKIFTMVGCIHPI